MGEKRNDTAKMRQKEGEAAEGGVTEQEGEIEMEIETRGENCRGDSRARRYNITKTNGN